MGFPGGAKEPACQCRKHKRHGLDPWVGKFPWRRAWQPLQYSCLENSTDRGAWQVGYSPWVAKSQTRLKRLSTHVCKIASGKLEDKWGLEPRNVGASRCQEGKGYIFAPKTVLVKMVFHSTSEITPPMNCAPQNPGNICRFLL